MSEKQHTYGSTLPILGEQVRLWRIACKMTQADLEVKAGLSHNAVSRIECGSVSPRVDTIERIAEALDVSVEQIQFQKPLAKVSETQEAYVLDEQISRLKIALEKVPEPKRSDLVRTFLDLVRITIDEKDS